MAADVSPRRQNSPLRQAQAAVTRLRIIEAAHAEFEAGGYEGTRIEDVAARAGVAVPTVYKTFASKRNLLTAAVTTAMTGGPPRPPAPPAPFSRNPPAPPPRRPRLPPAPHPPRPSNPRRPR